MITLNCDLGESFGAWTMGCDGEVMPHIDWANVACGFHAGSPQIMATTIALAKQHHVAVGAHPAYPDLQGFGRRSLAYESDELMAIVQYQVGAMRALCDAQGVMLNHVKPHGALYNDMQTNEQLFIAVVRAIDQLQQQWQQKVPLLTLAKPDGKALQSQCAIAAEYNVSLIFEAFADRRYEADGQLRARRHRDAVISHAAEILAQAEVFANHAPVTAIDGSQLLMHVDTLCVHGDNQASVETVKQIKQRFLTLTDNGTSNV